MAIDQNNLNSVSLNLCHARAVLDLVADSGNVDPEIKNAVFAALHFVDTAKLEVDGLKP